jgi:hypothetical protein
MLAKAVADPRYLKQKQEFGAILERRYHKVKAFLSSHQAPRGFVALPFNSGYFMCFECQGFSAETLRLNLLDNHGIGTIAIQDKWLRVAFSSVDEEDLDVLYTELFNVAGSMIHS